MRRPQGTASSGTRPWIGARPFRIEEADRFFGRQPEIYDAKALLAARGMLTIFGTSGAGKSSLIEAGVGYELQREGALLLPVARLRAEEHAGERSEAAATSSPATCFDRSERSCTVWTPNVSCRMRTSVRL